MSVNYITTINQQTGLLKGDWSRLAQSNSAARNVSIPHSKGVFEPLFFYYERNKNWLWKKTLPIKNYIF